MKKALRYILLTTGLLAMLIFCVSASASITDTRTYIPSSFFEPIKMLLLGLALIGVGTLMKNRLIR